MIQIASPPPVTPSSPLKPAKEINTRVADSRQLRESSHKPLVERRKQKDRRQHQRKGQFLESRSGRDRRRGNHSPGSSIDTTA